MKELYVGTSGYNYPHWRAGVFYPPGLSPSGYLEFYATKFDSVELNVTFYRLPSVKAFEGWARKTPLDFKFVLKGNRYITHIKRLRDVRDPLKNFSGNVTPLLGKISCVLWQLPPGLKKDEAALREFIGLLKRFKATRSVRHAFEFRNETWFVRPVFSMLSDNNISFCIADLPGVMYIEEFTADFIYMRFHGARERYSSNYSDTALKSAALKAAGWLEGRKALYAFFNNDARGYAPKNAVTFRGYLKKGLLKYATAHKE